MISPLKIPLLFYVAAIVKALIASPESNLNRIRILLFESFVDDSVPNTHVYVQDVPLITPPEEHPASPFQGTPDPTYAAPMFAQPLVADNDVVQVELSGIHTQHPP